MKKTLTFAFLLLFALNGHTQIPQGFSYQAVVRNSSGEIIANQPVNFRISILNFDGITVYFVETQTITTTPQGIANMVIGEGNLVSGSFSNIPWENGNINLKVEIDPTGGTSFAEMGSVPLKSVPYALYAPQTGEVVSPPEASDDEPIFVVRNKTGDIVFAVYQSGVRMYVDESVSKNTRGGFAIGGIGDNLKEGTEYFRVTPDSVRVNLREPVGKNARGGFAIGGIGDNLKVQPSNLFYIGQDSARIYIDTASNTKGTRGGFAIGGIGDNLKAQGPDLLRVTGDSTRIYINSSPTKNARGGFAIGGIGDNLKGNQEFLNVNPDASGILSSQPRILWYPLKNAFLAGQVKIENPTDVGENSMAIGYETKSKGGWSQALGYKSQANGNYSTAIGKNALAQLDNSFAFGDEAKAEGLNSYAFGTSANATGTGSFAFGSLGRDSATLSIGRIALASGDYSFAIGLGAQATNSSSFAMGQNATASGVFGLALGNYSTASGRQSSALGANSVASASYSTAISSGLAEGYNSTSIGYLTKTTGSNAISIGSGYVYSVSGGSYNVYSVASGSGSVTLGNGNNASGAYAMAMGFRNYTYGDQAIALGASLIARAYSSLVVGSYNVDNAGYSTFNWTLTDPLFVIGNGTYGSPSNAVTVLKNGKVGIGNTTTPNSRVHINSLVGEDALRVQVNSLTKLYVNSGGGVSIGSTTAAPANGLYVSGNVGIGVTSPTNKFEVNGNVKTTRIGAGSTITTPEYNVEAYGTNAAVVAHYSGESRGGIAALTNGRIAMLSTNSGDDLLFGYSPDIAQANFSTSFVERMRIDVSTGNVGIGTTNPGSYKLYVAGNAWSTGTWGSSDSRWKKNIAPIPNALVKAMQLTGVLYEWRREDFPELNFDSGIQVGLIAQEVEKIFPEIVKTNEDGYKAVAYDKLSAILLEAIKEQQIQIEELKNKNREIDAVKTELEEIKALLKK